MRIEPTAIRSTRWALDAKDREWINIGEGYKARVTGRGLYAVEIMFRRHKFVSIKDFRSAREAVEWRDGLAKGETNEQTSNGR